METLGKSLEEQPESPSTSRSAQVCTCLQYLLLVKQFPCSAAPVTGSLCACVHRTSSQGSLLRFFIPTTFPRCQRLLNGDGYVPRARVAQPAHCCLCKVFVSPAAQVPGVFKHVPPRRGLRPAGIDPTCGESISAGQVLPVSFSVVNSDHPLLVNSGCQARPWEPQGCHRGVGTREAKSQFASGEVFCRTCYCGRSHSSSLGLVCSGTSRIHTAEKHKAIICLLTYAKGRWDVTSSEAEH